jgi:hypothetical protein
MSSSDYVFGRGRSHGAAAAAADFIGGLTAGMTPGAAQPGSIPSPDHG